jgi:hypothetical protein
MFMASIHAQRKITRPKVHYFHNFMRLNSWFTNDAYALIVRNLKVQLSCEIKSAKDCVIYITILSAHKI